MEKPTQVSYANQVFDAVSHTALGAAAGFGLGKAFYPLQVKEGAIFGATLSTVAYGAQKLVSAIGFEENFISKTIISAATLAGAYFALTQPAASSLLQSVGFNFATDAMMKFCAASFVAELVLGAVKEYVYSGPSIQDEVDGYEKEVIEDAFKNWTDKTTGKDGKDPEISTAYQAAFIARFTKDGLYKAAVDGFTKAADVTAAPEHIIVFIFNENPEIKVAAVKKAADKRVAKLPALATKPDTKEAVEKLDAKVVAYAFNHYTVYTKNMKPEAKAALDARILADHPKRPEGKDTAEKKDAVAKMDRAQLAFIHANFAEYTKVDGKDMDKEVVEALEKAIVDAGLVAAAKPADKAAVAKLSKMEVLALHAKHNTVFGKKPDFKDVEVIKELNARYTAFGLAAQIEPTKPIDPPAPKGTVEKAAALWRNHAPAFLQNHEGKIASTVGLGLTYGVAKGFEAVTGFDIPVI